MGHDEQCRKWFDRKAAKTSNVIATKALASALSVQMWMECFHLPRGARTRWVTERIASAQTAAD